uniref:DUF3108 domain-containing protein n=1 Tax=Eiseniibacteriota bacterium TaxID=2212470 RepID=A0A832I4M5_UNCEI
MPRFGAGRVGDVVAAGRYAIHHAGAPCGEERWRVEVGADGLIVTAEQEHVAPHPFPNRQAWRATFTDAWRPTGLEVAWTVGARALRARHARDGARWRARIEYQGAVREQEGDFPEACEVEFTSPLFVSAMLARRAFAPGGEHEFPVLRIGPPWMAVEPERMRIVCVERGEHGAPWGRVPAQRYVVSLADRADGAAYGLWADADDLVLETFEGPDPGPTWMRLVEYRAAG